MNEIMYYKEKIKRLNKIGVMISKEKDIDKLLNLMLDESITLTNSDAGSIYFKEEIEGQNLLVFKCSINRTKNVPFIGESIKIDETSVAGLAALRGNEVILNNNNDLKVNIDKSFDKKLNYETVNMIVIPMKNEVDKVVGVFQILNKKSLDGKIIPYNEEDIDLVKSLA